MTYRAEKTGIAAEVQKKLAGKYDQELAGQCLNWLKVISSRDGKGDSMNTAADPTSFCNTLKDGYILCRAMNVIKPGSIPDKRLNKRETMAFKQMEMIGMFIQKLKENGVADHENFQTVDLYESVNLCQVVTALQALARKGAASGFPGFGPKEAEKNERHFTQEQLTAGQNVIGLQMGSNKGASQSGQSFGKTRMIID